MTLSTDLVNKSVQAAVAAIEIYNKPNFSYREEAFALLMTNAWELMLKAKWALDHGESHECLYALVRNKQDQLVPKPNRCGNPQSLSLPELALKLAEDKHSGLQKGCYDNILALLEIRDNAAHFINKDLYLGRRVLEIGTASLRNYLSLSTEWFQIDLSAYNFFLMPLSFYHGFEAAEPVSRLIYPLQVQNLLSFIDALEEANDDDNATQHVTMRIETKFVRSKDSTAVAFRYTNDPDAPAVIVREEEFLKNYPLTYRDLTDALKRRYSNFVENTDYHNLRKQFQQERKYSIERILNPHNPRSSRQRFFNSNIIQEFDKRYQRRSKAIAEKNPPTASLIPNVETSGE